MVNERARLHDRNTHETPHACPFSAKVLLHSFEISMTQSLITGKIVTQEFLEAGASALRERRRGFSSRKGFNGSRGFISNGHAVNDLTSSGAR